MEVDVGIELGNSAHLPANNAVGHSPVDFIRVSFGVGMDGAVDHPGDVEQEQQAAEHITAFSVVFVHWPSLHVLEIWLFFCFLLSSHCYF